VSGCLTHGAVWTTKVHLTENCEKWWWVHDDNDDDDDDDDCGVSRW